MGWNSFLLMMREFFKVIFVPLTIALLFNACTISYKFNGASIDYTKTKSISISDFNNVADLINPQLAQEFTEKLRDKYSKQTRLKVIKNGGDMHLEGEIVGYDLTPMSIGADTYSAETKLTVTVKVRFVNNANSEDDFEKNYSAFQTFDSNLMITDIQDDLLTTIIEDITDNIYNDTVAKW